MKKFLLSILFASTVLSAQNVKSIIEEKSIEPFSQNAINTIGNNKNFFTNKDVYHRSVNFEILSINRTTYDDDYTKVVKTETKAPDGRGGFYVQFRDIYHYDQNGRVTLIEGVEDKKGNGELEKYFKTLFEYNSNGSLNIKTELSWDEDLNRYILNRRYTHFYKDGRLSHVKWESRGFEDQFTDYYTYDAQGRKIEVLRKYEDNVEGGAYIQRETYTYDDKGRQSGYLFEKYNVQKKIWDPNYKQEISYDNDGNVINQTSYNNNGAEWFPAFLTEPVEYNMNEEYSNTYGGGVLPSKNVITQYNAYEYDRLSKKWDQLTHNELFYEWDVLATKNIKNEKEVTKLYPNPTTDYFTVKVPSDIESVEVYSLSGQRVKRFENQQEKYSVSDLSKGTYVVIIKTKSKQYNLKLIKK